METKFLGLLLLSALLTFGAFAQGKATLSKQEKNFLLDYLTITEEGIIDELNALNEDQWAYTPADGGWSVGECMEHVLVAEMGLLMQARKAMEAEADNSLNTRHQDAWLISKVNDRGTKVNTPLPPIENIRDKEEIITAFKESREAVRAFYDDDKKPFRNHFGKSPYGPADVYQIGLVVGAHSMRHHHQIKEILAEMQPAAAANE